MSQTKAVENHYSKTLQMMKNKGGMGRIFGLKWAKLQSFLGLKAEELRKV